MPKYTPCPCPRGRCFDAEGGGVGCCAERAGACRRPRRSPTIDRALPPPAGQRQARVVAGAAAVAPEPEPPPTAPRGRRAVAVRSAHARVPVAARGRRPSRGTPPPRGTRRLAQQALRRMPCRDARRLANRHVTCRLAPAAAAARLPWPAAHHVPAAHPARRCPRSRSAPLAAPWPLPRRFRPPPSRRSTPAILTTTPLPRATPRMARAGDRGAQQAAAAAISVASARGAAAFGVESESRVRCASTPQRASSSPRAEAKAGRGATRGTRRAAARKELFQTPTRARNA